MKILVAIRDATESLRISSILRKLGHDVEISNNGREAAMSLARALPHVVFADVAMAMPSGRELVRHIRRLLSPHYIYIVMFSLDDNEPQIAREYEAGVDHEIEPPINPHQIEARLYAAQRILDFEEALRRRIESENSGDMKKSDSYTLRTLTVTKHTESSGQFSTFKTPPPTQSQGFYAVSPGEIVLRSAAWASLQSNFQSAIARFLLVDFAACSAPQEEPSHAYRMVLSNQTKQLEIHLFLAATQANLREIAGYMFGKQSDAEGRVLEGLSRMLATALKDSLAAEHLTFSESDAGEYSSAKLTQAEAKHLTEALFFSFGDVRFSVYLNVRFKGNTILPITALQEGMLIGKDILNKKGLLLLSKGARISNSMKERLCDCLPQNHMVEVTCE